MLTLPKWSDGRNYVIDLLKIVSCFFVFRIHMGAVSPYTPFVLFAVPIFVFLTGYNYTGHCARREIGLRGWFAPRNLLRMAARLYLPYLVFALCQLILIFALGADYPIGNVILSFFVGGYGPGNYYLLLMLQIILVFPLLLFCTRKRPRATLVCTLLFYAAYHLFMNYVLPGHPGDVTSVGGAINKWGVLRWIFLLECGIYLYVRRDAVRWWHLAPLIAIDATAYILEVIGGLRAWYSRGIPYHFAVIGIVGLCLKYLSPLSFGRCNVVIAYCGSASWHIFLFQQLYFWLIALVGWQFGFGYISFAICFAGGLLFYTAHVLIRKCYRHLRGNR